MGSVEVVKTRHIHNLGEAPKTEVSETISEQSGQHSFHTRSEQEAMQRRLQLHKIPSTEKSSETNIEVYKL